MNLTCIAGNNFFDLLNSKINLCRPGSVLKAYQKTIRIPSPFKEVTP